MIFSIDSRVIFARYGNTLWSWAGSRRGATQPIGPFEPLGQSPRGAVSNSPARSLQLGLSSNAPSRPLVSASDGNQGAPLACWVGRSRSPPRTACPLVQQANRKLRRMLDLQRLQLPPDTATSILVRSLEWRPSSRLCIDFRQWVSGALTPPSAFAVRIGTDSDCAQGQQRLDLRSLP